MFELPFWFSWIILILRLQKVYNKKLKMLLDNELDDAPRTAEISENKPGHGDEGPEGGIGGLDEAYDGQADLVDRGGVMM